MDKYLKYRASLAVPGPKADTYIGRDLEGLARINLTARLVEASMLGEEPVIEVGRWAGEFIEGDFPHNLAEYFSEAFKLPTPISEGSPWCSFYAAVASHCEGKRLTPAGAKKRWSDARKQGKRADKLRSQFARR